MVKERREVFCNSSNVTELSFLVVSLPCKDCTSESGNHVIFFSLKILLKNMLLYANSRVSISLHNTRSKTTARISKIVAATWNVCAQPRSATIPTSLLENIFSPTFLPCTVYKVPTPTSSFSSGDLIIRI